MDNKRVTSLYIRLNNNNELRIKESKIKSTLAEISNKYHNLLQKYKKELADLPKSN